MTIFFTDVIISSESRTGGDEMKFNYNKLKGKIKEVYDTQENFTRELGLSRTSLNQRLNNHLEFSQSEILKSCKLLNINIKNINEYFFKINVQKNELDKVN